MGVPSASNASSFQEVLEVAASHTSPLLEVVEEEASYVAHLLFLLPFASLLFPLSTLTEYLQLNLDQKAHTITRLAIQRVHVEDNIVYPVHRIYRGRIVSVSERISQLSGSCLVLVSSLVH